MHNSLAAPCVSIVAGLALMLGVSCSAAEDGASKTARQQNQAGQADLLKTFAGEFVTITPGTGKFPKSFVMGSDNGAAAERPTRTVTMTDEFAMGKHEVTQELYQAVIGSNPSVWGGPRNSVEMVTFRDAVLFCRRATGLLREAKLIGADEVIRLPSEAEWEYCCRAGTTTAFSFGASATAEGDEGAIATILDAYGWHTGNAAGNDPPVGALKPNAWGLYDMHGYLWEYVGDSWHDDFAGAPAGGRAWEPEREHALRVIRGGSWRDRHELLRSSTRWPCPDHARSDAIGFRCVKARVAH